MSLPQGRLHPLVPRLTRPHRSKTSTAHLIKRLDIRNPSGNGEVDPPVPFNLMFKSFIGPSAAAPIYLRP